MSRGVLSETVIGIPVRFTHLTQAGFASKLPQIPELLSDLLSTPVQTQRPGPGAVLATDTVGVHLR